MNFLCVFYWIFWWWYGGVSDVGGGVYGLVGGRFKNGFFDFGWKRYLWFMVCRCIIWGVGVCEVKSGFCYWSFGWISVCCYSCWNRVGWFYIGSGRMGGWNCVIVGVGESEWDLGLCDGWGFYNVFFVVGDGFNIVVVGSVCVILWMFFF